MRMMKFSAIYLLSFTERAATSVRFEDDVTVIRAPNGWGKSGILKSLYETFGAEPHRVDQSWREAKVASAVEFSIDDVSYTILRFLGEYAVFDADGRLLIKTSSVTDELTPFLARVTSFGLRMADRKERVITPPPAYIFAPYYVDQDKSWSTPWSPFVRLYLPDSARTLTEYHSGIRPNEYYKLVAEKELLNVRSKEAQDQAAGLTSALDHILSSEDTASTEPLLHLRIEDFLEETAVLVAKSRDLTNVQDNFRAKLGELLDIRALWKAQSEVSRVALAESDAVFRKSVDSAPDVECPTCGAHYVNDITARFNIAADSGALLTVLRESEAKVAEIDDKISLQRKRIEALSSAHSQIETILQTRRNNTSLEQILRSEGRQEAVRTLRDKMAKINQVIGEIAGQIAHVTKELKKLVDPERSRQIKDYFNAQLIDAANRLDVLLPKKLSMSSTAFARGSEGPRGIAAYFYSFLRTVRKYGSSTFCPIVIDAPNQQGQDAEHLPQILAYLLEQRPADTQLILGVEDVYDVPAESRSFRSVGLKKRKLLDPSEFERVNDHMRPMLVQMMEGG